MPFLHDSPPLPAIRPRCPRFASGALDALFARFTPPALNNFRHPCMPPESSSCNVCNCYICVHIWSKIKKYICLCCQSGIYIHWMVSTGNGISKEWRVLLFYTLTRCSLQIPKSNVSPLMVLWGSLCD